MVSNIGKETAILEALLLICKNNKSVSKFVKAFASRVIKIMRKKTKIK